MTGTSDRRGRHRRRRGPRRAPHVVAALVRRATHRRGCLPRRRRVRRRRSPRAGSARPTAERRPDHRPHRPAPAGRRRRTSAKYNFYETADGRLRVVLRDRAQVLAAVLRGRRSPGSHRRATTWATRRSTSPTATSRCGASCRPSSARARRPSGSPSHGDHRLPLGPAHQRRRRAARRPADERPSDHRRR